MKKFHSFILVLYVFLIHFEYWSFAGSANDNFTISKLAAIVYILIYFLRYNNLNISSKIVTFVKYLFILYLIKLYGSIINNNYHATIFDILDLTILQNIILYLLMANHLEKEPELINKSLIFFVLGGILFSILVDLGIGIHVANNYRVYIFWEDPNWVAYRIVFTIIIALSLIFSNTKIGKLKYLFIIAIPLFLVTIVIASSRGSVILLIMSSMIFVLVSKISLGKRVLLILLIAAFSLVMYGLIMSNVQFLSRINLTLELGDTAQRTIIWEKISDLIWINPIFGIGDSGYIEYSYKIFGKYRSAHNEYLELLIKTGFTGLLMFIIFLKKNFNASIFLYKKDGNIMYVLLMIGLIFMMTNLQGLNSKLIYYFYAIVFAAYINSKEEKSFIRGKTLVKTE